MDSGQYVMPDLISNSESQQLQVTDADLMTPKRHVPHIRTSLTSSSSSVEPHLFSLNNQCYRDLTRDVESLHINNSQTLGTPQIYAGNTVPQMYGVNAVPQYRFDPVSAESYSQASSNQHTQVKYETNLHTGMMRVQGPWTAYSSASNNIIREQESVIEQQRARLAELEFMLSNQLPNSVYSSHRGDQWQNSLHQNIQSRHLLQTQSYYPVHPHSQSQQSLHMFSQSPSSIHTSAFSVPSSHAEDILNLRAELGAVESELEDLKKSSSEEIKKRDEMIAQLNSKIEEKDVKLSDWSSRFESLTNQLEDVRSQSEHKDKYLEKLPTSEEHERNIRTISQLQAALSKSKVITQVLNKKIEDLNKSVASRDSLIKQLETEQLKSCEQIKQLQTSKEELEKILEMRADLVQIQILRRELDQLQTFADNMTQSLERERSSWSVKEKKLCASLTNAQLLANQESECVTALRAEAEKQEERLIACRQTVKQLSDERDDWMRKFLEEESRLREAESVVKATADKRLIGQLLRELGQCYSRLKVVVDVLLEISRGEQPNFTRLLQLNTAHTACSPSSSAGVPLCDDTVQRWLDKVKAMIKDIDILKETVTQKVAEESGRRISCAQQ